MIITHRVHSLLDFVDQPPLTSEEMARTLTVTFFPYDPRTLSSNILSFALKLEETLKELGVTIIPYETAFISIPLGKRLLRVVRIIVSNVLYFAKKIFSLRHAAPWMSFAVVQNALKRDRLQPEIAVVALGENPPGNLPVDVTSSFRKTSIVTILDQPKHITKESSFDEHFQTALDLFAHHMTNVAITVTGAHWTLYNFNASHPTFSFTKEQMHEGVLHALIPKLAAPMQPARLKEFVKREGTFDPASSEYKKFVDDMVESGPLFDKAKLYPRGKKIDDLPFRTNFYRWIGDIHLDQRNGMSYGFLARQLPVTIEPVLKAEEFTQNTGMHVGDDSFLRYGDDLFLSLKVRGERIVLKTPEISVLSQRSGSDKTKMNPATDLIKMSLKSGRMYLETPRGLKLDATYKPSFDTKVILAHCLGNALVASLSAYLNVNEEFVKNLTKHGAAISHWHGYINPACVPDGWQVHGTNKPHVACSSPQSSMYALIGKLEAFEDALEKNIDFQGDIHVEPHHGSNMTYTTLYELASLFETTPEMSELGNKYLTE